MVARYGNFVTYDPPLTPLTVLLWVLPLAAIVAGGWIIVARTRRQLRPDRQLSAGQGLAAGNGADARAAGAGAGPAGAAAE
ncbi:cytochrome c-type biogenesis protein CcmH, partial [Salmonella enterica]|nr:cytochrome c-type biogenesis protein CcmH [Salmonella enterica]